MSSFIISCVRVKIFLHGREKLAIPDKTAANNRFSFYKCSIAVVPSKLSSSQKSSLIESVCLSLNITDDVTKEDILRSLWCSEDVIREGRAAHGCVAWVGIKIRVRAAHGCVAWPKLTSKLYKYFRNPVALERV